MKNLFLAVGVMCLATAHATPVEVNWGTSETLPVKVARPFGGFLKDGSFLVAGGSTHDGTTKGYEQGGCLRDKDAKTWSKVGERA